MYPSIMLNVPYLLSLAAIYAMLIDMLACPARTMALPVRLLSCIDWFLADYAECGVWQAISWLLV